MNRKLHISDFLSLPLDTITSTIIVYGGKGMGKSSFATVLCEELNKSNQRFSVIDPMGVFYGLRHSVDGKGRGIEVLILGGLHGDIPVEPSGGAVVADLVADESVNTIIDISRHPNGKMWSIGERIRFVADYCTRLYERQGEKRRPILQIIDEAARFCPQQIPHGAVDVARCSGAVSTMVEEGRNVGIGVCLITQRSARMNKSVSEVADCMIAFRIVGPLSIAAVLDWFGEHVEKSRWKELIEKLRTLPRGTALVVSPGWLEFEGVAAIRARETFDSSATPKDGEERRASGAGAKPDLKRYQERMAETIKRQKENDPAVLKKTIIELKRALEAPRKEEGSVDASQVEKAVQTAILKQERVFQGHLEALKRALAGNAAKVKGIADKLAELAEQASRLSGVLAVDLNISTSHFSTTNEVKKQEVRQQGPRPAISHAPRLQSVKPVGFNENNNGDSRKLRAGAERMLAALVSWPDGLSVGQMRSHAGLKKSGTFTTYLSDLRRGGYIEESNDQIKATDRGREYFGDSEIKTPTSTEEVVAVWKPKLRDGARRMLDVLVELGGESISTEELFSRSGLSNSGTATTYLSDLRTARLAVTPERGMVAAAKDTLLL